MSLKKANDPPPRIFLSHKMPLNEKGDTVESLKAEGDPYKLQAIVLSWLKKTVAKLEQGVATSK
ncbi:MAG: hypothetical protein ACHQIK_01025 [Candidatus Acidiferrales bacterium]